MCVGMSTDLFSAFPNLIIPTGLGTGPLSEEEKESGHSENENGQKLADLQRKTEREKK